ncbi:MAG: amidohydrolase family protein [Desulfurococcaceae archaeon]
MIKLYRKPLVTKELLNTLIQYSIILDYQELPELCNIYYDILNKYSVEYISLSRPRDWNDLDELKNVLDKCSGLGIANPTHIPYWVVRELSFVSRKYPVSSHISETEYMEKTGGLHYLLSNNVLLKHVVHGTFLEDWELKLLSDLNIPLIITPRSNLWFLHKLPNILKAFEYNVTIALGTDNAGCFHPDIWIEAYILAYLLKIPIDKLLEMILINGYRAIGRKPLTIEEGGRAYFMIVDLGLANTRSGFQLFSIINRILWSKRKIIVKNNKLYVLETRSKPRIGLNI